MHLSQILSVVILTAVPLMSAHGSISRVTGNLGWKRSGFDVAAGGDSNLGDVTVSRSSAGAFGATSVSTTDIYG